MKSLIAKISFYSFFVIVAVLFLALFFIIKVLYGSAVERERAVLISLVSSNASLLDSVVSLDDRVVDQDFMNNNNPANIRQIQDFIVKYHDATRLNEMLILKDVADGYLVISSSDKHNINKLFTKEDTLSKNIENSLRKKLGVFNYTLPDGVAELIAFSPIEGTPYSLVLRADLTKLWMPYYQSICVVFAVCFIVCVLFILYLVKFIQPIVNKLHEEYKKSLETMADLQTNEERLEIALSANNDGVFDWNTVTNEVYFDARYYTMAGYDPDEFPGKLEEWVSRVHLEDLPRIEKILKAYFANDLADYDVEFRFKRKDESWMWIRARIKILGRNEKGEPLRVIGTHTDITSLKTTEIELKSREEMFRNFFELGLIGMAITSLEKGWVEFNETLSSMFGYGEEELRSKTWSELTHPEDLQKDTIQYEKVLAGQVNGYSLEKRFIKKSGEIVYAVISVAAVKNEKGQIEYFVALVHDITGLKLTELELRKNEEDLRVTLNSIGDAVISTDIYGHIVRMNKVAEQLIGLKVEDALGRNLEEVFTIVNAISREPVDTSVQSVFASGETAGLENHTLLLSKDGGEYRIAYSGSPIKSEDNTFVGVVLVFRDITEDYVLQDQLRHSQKMDAIGQLAGGVAHDFNNMLGGILMAASILKRFVPDIPKAQNAHKVIIEAADHAAALTQKLLTFARKQHSKMKAVDLHAVISDTIALLRDTIDRRIQIKVDLLAKMSVVIGDASQLQSAFLNLGINASHAMQKGGVLTIRTEIIELSEKDSHKNQFKLKPGVYIQVEVEDTGTGMSKDIMHRIFEPFFTTKDMGKGTGLGLAAVYGTVQQQGGSITVESIEGQGSVFQICLPISSVRIEKSDIKEEVPVGTGVILIVDDEKIMRDTMLEILETYGYELLVAENGTRALDIFKSLHSTIDLVILDMVMPEMSGLDCFVEMKKINPSVKVILASGFTDDEDFSAMKEEGVVDFLKKPFHGEDLGQAVYNTLKKKS